MTSLDLAWAAGFFDGEGYVTIGESSHDIKSKLYRSHYLRIGINHVAPAPVYEMQRILGGNIEYTDKVVGNRKPRYRWTCSSAVAAEVLEKLLPYLRNKQEVAKLGLEFAETTKGINRRTGVPEDVLEKRKSLKRAVQTMNSKD